MNFNTCITKAVMSVLLIMCYGQVSYSQNDPSADTILMEELPYHKEALEPHIMARTFSFHYNRHYDGYVKRANQLIRGTRYQGMKAEDIIRESCGKEEDREIFNNTAQAWNHAFYFKSMKPGGGGEPNGKLLKKIVQSFRSYPAFREEFMREAQSLFGSGWVWLVVKGGKVQILSTSNADTPITEKGVKPLLVVDVWEHAYYLDRQINRGDYVRRFIDHLVNWDFAQDNMR